MITSGEDPARELAPYEDAFQFLTRQGWHQAKVNREGLAPGIVAAKVADLLGVPDSQKRK